MCNPRFRRRRTAGAIVLAGATTSLLVFPISIETSPAGRIARETSAVRAQAMTIAIGARVAEAAEPGKQSGKTKWTCPMHPHYIADEFGTCPICGMNLVKLDTGGIEPGASQAESRSVVTIAPEVIQNIGVRIGKVERSRFGRSIRSYGIVHENERLTSEFTARVEGWVQDLKVTAVGDKVKKGEPLFRLYSPRLIVSQNDLFLTTTNRASVNRGTTQLRALGVQDEALEQIKQNGRPLELVPFFADRTGTVTEISLKEGTYVKRGMLIARIQDYSTVWLRVSVAEQDLPFITQSSNAMVTFPNIPGQEIKANIDYVYPTIDAKTRTGQVRLVIPNANGTIRPGGYADVVFEVGSSERIAVPSEAVMRNGKGEYVVISLGQGRFQPRAERPDWCPGGETEITSGVEAGEDIVVSGQFLIDSESALRESFRKLQRMQLRSVAPQARYDAVRDGRPHGRRRAISARGAGRRIRCRAQAPRTCDFDPRSAVASVQGHPTCIRPR